MKFALIHHVVNEPLLFLVGGLLPAILSGFINKGHRHLTVYSLWRTRYILKLIGMVKLNKLKKRIQRS